jgi:hypothetical protein
MSITERKRVALEQKIAALDAEFKHWIEITEANAEFEKHHTQVRALTGHLSGLWAQTQLIFKQSEEDETVLAGAQNVESLVLGLRRIWEFFRSKLVQRRDPGMRPFLQAADELAWACYKPILDLCSVGQRREPPLVFLNGGLSPYALSRDKAFLAEDVPGQALSGQTYDPILQRLPIPVIGVPWHQVAHLPDLPVVAHETGHAVEQDFGLHDPVFANLRQALGEQSPRLARWNAWSKEVFADMWGCLTLGPAYANSLVDFLAGDRPVIEHEIATDKDKYPSAHLRVMLCVKALGLMSFDKEGKELESEWAGEYGQHAMRDFDLDVLPVAKAILSTPLARPGLTKPLLEIENLPFTTNDWKWAIEGAGELKKGQLPQTANTIIRWAAAARYLYEKSPDLYATKKFGDSLLTYSKTLIKPGTRAGEDVVDETKKKNIFDESQLSGSAWFKEFAQWANAPASTKQMRTRGL